MFGRCEMRFLHKHFEAAKYYYFVVRCSAAQICIIICFAAFGYNRNISLTLPDALVVSYIYILNAYLPD